MKKQLQVMAVSLASILSVANAHAGMIEAANGDDVLVIHGANHDSVVGGGEFLVSDRMAGKDYQYLGFCLEKEEKIQMNFVGYSLDDNTGVADFADKGGIDYGDSTPNQDYLSNATKWLMNQYVTNYASFYAHYNSGAGDSNSFAGLVQNAIWYFEDEISVGNSLTTAIVANIFSDTLSNATRYQADFLTSIKVFNVVREGATDPYRQSIVVSAPAPEPATMLLFGTGLAGVIGVMRSRRNKEN